MCRRDNSHFLHYVVFFPGPKSCALHNFDTLRHILIMFGGNEKEDQYACPVYSHFLHYVVVSPEAEVLCRR